MNQYYTIQRINEKVSQNYFKQQTLSKGENIINEYEFSNSIYFLLEGQVSLIRQFQPVNFTNFQKPNTKMTILNLNKGEIFGEDNLFFKRKNRFSVKVQSITATFIEITYQDFEKQFSRTSPHLIEIFEQRHQMINRQIKKFKEINQIKGKTVLHNEIQRKIQVNKEWTNQPLQLYGIYTNQYQKQLKNPGILNLPKIKKCHSNRSESLTENISKKLTNEKTRNSSFSNL